jgi:hypothetical protein
MVNASLRLLLAAQASELRSECTDLRASLQRAQQSLAEKTALLEQVNAGSQVHLSYVSQGGTLPGRQIVEGNHQVCSWLLHTCSALIITGSSPPPCCLLPHILHTLHRPLLSVASRQLGQPRMLLMPQ